MSRHFPYTNSTGEDGKLTGGFPGVIPLSESTKSWTQREHPDRAEWIEDEQRQRASYIATRKVLTPFLVPHRFEGKSDPTSLNRAKLSYGIGLNQSYLHEIFGHIRSTPAHYTWGLLGGPSDQDTLKEPVTGKAEQIWWDVTGDGVNWTNFWSGEVLEWMLTSPGALVLIDSNRTTEQLEITQSQARAAGVRAYLRMVPFSWVEDYGRGPLGYRWIKFAEQEDKREPRSESDDSGFESRHLLYELLPDGRTRISRWDDEGAQIGTDVFQKVTNTDGRGTLPIVPVMFGRHPTLAHLGRGMLTGLDDIVIDLYNLLTEIREAYRDVVFSFLTYRGGDGESIQTQLEGGTRLVNIGDDPHAQLSRIGAEGGEVQAGLSLLEVGLKNWAFSAKKRATEVVESTDVSRSGVSLKAEFQLDLVPVMVSIAQKLDECETSGMFILAQIEGKSTSEANTLKVRREKEFQMEQESSRITRIVKEFVDSIPGMPAALLKKLIMRWAESLDFLDLDEEVEAGDGTKKPLRKVVEEQAEEIAEADQQARIRQNEFGILGAAALGAEMGGSKGGGGDPNKPKPKPKPTPANAGASE